MPLQSSVLAIVFVRQGMPQTSLTATTLEGGKWTIAIGPVASQLAIKQLGNKWRRLLQRQLGAP